MPNKYKKIRWYRLAWATEVTGRLTVRKGECLIMFRNLKLKYLIFQDGSAYKPNGYNCTVSKHCHLQGNVEFLHDMPRM